jgi:hypothetical protein
MKSQYHGLINFLLVGPEKELDPMNIGLPCILGIGKHTVMSKNMVRNPVYIFTELMYEIGIPE